MATNPYFRKSVRSEQNLIDDLSVEVIKIHGYDMIYLPRTLVREDELFGEDRSPSRFSSGVEIEMLVESVDGFEGDGEAFTRFGLEIKDNIVFLVSVTRFKEELACHNLVEPREGDLIYFTVPNGAGNGFFEIDYVERHNPFYQLSNITTYKLTCSAFRYSGEDFNTGWSKIDGLTSDHRDQFTTLTLTTGSGNYLEGEFVVQGDGSTIAALVQEWDKSNKVLQVTGVTGEFQTSGITVSGISSGAEYLLGSAGTTNTYSVPNFNDDNIGFENSNLFDFTDTDPFSEGDL